MKDYTEFVDVTLSDFSDNKECAKELEDFKTERKNQMRSRELVLRERGLSDSKVIYDLIVSENLDTRHDFIKCMRKSMEEKIEKQRMLIKFLMAVAYFMAVGIWFILDSFYNHDWGHSWLIIVGGIVVFTIMLFVMPKKMHYKGRRKFTMTTSLMISAVLAAIYAFLLMTSFDIPHSYIIIPVSFAVICLIDAVVPALLHHKFAIIHTLISTPLFGTFLYVSLGLMHILPWATGWLLIIATCIIDILVFVSAFFKRLHMIKEGESYGKE